MVTTPTWPRLAGRPNLLTSDGVYSTLPTYTVTANGTYGLARSYDYWQGTSMAAPLVSGLAALLLAVDPSLTPDQVEGIMASTAVDLGPTGWDQDYGWGRIDLARAVGQVAPPPRVGDLSITAVTAADAGLQNVALAWTPPLQANSVTIRRSTAPITAANWASATLVVSGLAPTTSAYTATNVPYAGGALYFRPARRWQIRPGHTLVGRIEQRLLASQAGAGRAHRQVAPLARTCLERATTSC